MGQSLVGIAHSQYSKREFIKEGIGPAAFRSHFITLSNGLVIDLFVCEICLSALPSDAMDGETNGLTPEDLFGRQIEAVVKDETNLVLIALERRVLLWDGNDALRGNPLWAADYIGFSSWRNYKPDFRQEFRDYWTDAPVSLAAQIRQLLARRPHLTEKKMFGGLGFLLNGNICCGAWKEFLILRLGEDAARQVLSEPHARPFDITGRPMRGWAMIERAGWQDETKLRRWVTWAADFTVALPAK